MLMRHPVLPALVLAAALLAACGGDRDPVARVGVSAGEVPLPHGALAPVELRIEPLRELGEGKKPLLFAHLLDAEGTVVRTFDHPLPGGWRVGEEIVDQVPLAQPVLGPALPRGDYRLTIGLYDGGEERWPLEGLGEEVARLEYPVATVKVPELDPDAPRFVFSDEWLPLEATGDRQTLARRWLAGDGTLRVARLPAPARLAMQLRIPESHEQLLMVLEPGATVPTVRVTSDCSGFAATVQGTGFHALTVPIPRPRCLLRFDSNFTLNDTSAPRRLSVALEQLAWTRAPGAAAAVEEEPAGSPAPSPSTSPAQATPAAPASPPPAAPPGR